MVNSSNLKCRSPLSPRERARVRVKAAAVSTENAIEMMKLTKRQIEVTVFACGVGTVEDLKVGKFVKQSDET